MGLGQKSTWLFPGRSQHSSKQAHDGAADSQKKEAHQARLETIPRAEPSWKRPCSQVNCVRTKKLHWSSPSKYKLLYAPHPNANTNSSALTNLFTLTEFGYKLENFWQNQSSQKCQLRKLLLPTASNCTHRTTSTQPAICNFSSQLYHPKPSVSLSQDPNRMAPGTAHILKVPGQKAQQLGFSIPIAKVQQL